MPCISIGIGDTQQGTYGWSYVGDVYRRNTMSSLYIFSVKK